MAYSIALERDCWESHGENIKNGPGSLYSRCAPGYALSKRFPSYVVCESLFLGMLFNEEGVSMVLMPWKVDLCISDPFTSVFQQASAKANHPDMA
jgi:hypothetical protein